MDWRELGRVREQRWVRELSCFSGLSRRSSDSDELRFAEGTQHLVDRVADHRAESSGVVGVLGLGEGPALVADQPRARNSVGTPGIRELRVEESGRSPGWPTPAATSRSQ